MRVGPGLAVVMLLITACSNAASPTPASRASGTPNPPASTSVSPQRLIARIPLDWAPTLVASGYGYLWIVSAREQTVARLDPTLTHGNQLFTLG